MLTTITTYSWWLQLSARPYPKPVTSRPLAVEMPMRRGIWMLEQLIADGEPVGPVMVCVLHNRMSIPVQADAAHSPLTARLTMTNRVECARDSYYGPCPAQFWMLPAHRRDATFTAIDALHDSLHRLRRGAWPRPAVAAA